ncbi:MAG: hypothetical protein WDO56_18280 [Gammaproteobacteria bacterium]
MNWLQAALAFALIMLVLATIVTILLEAGYRALLTREKGFRLMMSRLFDEVLKPRVAHLLRGVTVAEAREHFLNAVTLNQAYEGRLNRVRAFIQPNELSSMTMMQFADRLADTEVGKAIARGGAAYVETAVNDLAQKFERFGAASSQRFQDHARFWCVLASVILAFVANVDAVRVFQNLLHDDTLTSGVIARYGSAVDENAQRPQDPVASLELIENLHRDQIVGDEELKSFKQSVATAQLKLVELRDTGLPMTIEYWPFCTGVLGNTGRGAQPESPSGQAADNSPIAPDGGEQKPVDRKCTTVTTDLFSWTGVKDVWSRLRPGAGSAWFLSVLLAGLLIGLGAPFWFDLARGLTRSAQLLRAAGLGSKEQKPAAAAPVADASASPPPRTPVEAFKVAIAAAQPVRARVLLAPNGRVIRGA